MKKSFKEKVEKIIVDQVNPALSLHGGFAKLQKVDGYDVYIIMGGGCQGCAAAGMTLKMGIKNLLVEELPEIGEVIDVTEHSLGTNPFYNYDFSFGDTED